MKNEHSMIFRPFVPMPTPEAPLCFFPCRRSVPTPQPAIPTTFIVSCSNHKPAQGRVKRAMPPSPFIRHPGTRALNQTRNMQNTCNPQKQLPLQEIPPHLLRPLFLTSLHFPEAAHMGITWPWMFTAIEGTLHEHRNIPHIANQNLCSHHLPDCLTGEDDNRKPWRAHTWAQQQSCSVPKSPRCLGDAKIQRPWKNRRVLKHS